MTAGDHCPPSTSYSHHSPPPTPNPSMFDFYYALSAISILALVFIVAIIVSVQQESEIKPRFDLQQVGVQYLNVVNGPTATTASVSFAIWILFAAENDNTDTEYGLSTFNITYRGTPLGWATLPWFDQEDNGVKRVQTTVTVDRVILNAADLVRDALLNDRVELRIMGDVNAKMPIGFWTSRITTVSIDCVIAISPRKQALTSKLCGSDVFKI